MAGIAVRQERNGDHSMWNSIINFAKMTGKSAGKPSDACEGVGPIDLDRDSRVTFLRLKRKLPHLKDEEVIAHALKALERKTDRIIRRIAAKQVNKLTSEGLSPEYIAEQLNKAGVPPMGETDRWYVKDVSDLQKQVDRTPAGE
jgi:hypothetical protein